MEVKASFSRSSLCISKTPLPIAGWAAFLSLVEVQQQERSPLEEMRWELWSDVDSGAAVPTCGIVSHRFRPAKVGKFPAPSSPKGALQNGSSDLLAVRLSRFECRFWDLGGVRLKIIMHSRGYNSMVTFLLHLQKVSGSILGVPLEDLRHQKGPSSA